MRPVTARMQQFTFTQKTKERRQYIRTVLKKDRQNKKILQNTTESEEI